MFPENGSPSVGTADKVNAACSARFPWLVWTGSYYLTSDHIVPMDNFLCSNTPELIQSDLLSSHRFFLLLQKNS